MNISSSNLMYQLGFGPAAADLISLRRPPREGRRRRLAVLPLPSWKPPAAAEGRTQREKAKSCKRLVAWVGNGSRVRGSAGSGEGGSRRRRRGSSERKKVPHGALHRSPPLLLFRRHLDGAKTLIRIHAAPETEASSTAARLRCQAVGAKTIVHLRDAPETEASATATGFRE
jgi:hypothetical protein